MSQRGSQFLEISSESFSEAKDKSFVKILPASQDLQSQLSARPR